MGIEVHFYLCMTCELAQPGVQGAPATAPEAVMLATSWSIWRQTLKVSAFAVLPHEAVTLADTELKEGFDNVPT